MKVTIIGTGQMARRFATTLAPKAVRTVFALAEDMGFHPVDVGTLMVRRLTGPRHLDAATVAEMAQPPKRLT